MPPAGRPPATGPGPLTEDGCAVEVYARLPAAGEPELVHRHTPPGGSVLDLGAGTGRVADPLCRLGHRVVAVDASAEMLARVQLARPVRAAIEGLDLGERFDVVLLASHLVNRPDPAERDALVATVARHLAPGGTALLQWHPPEWFDALSPGTVVRGVLGPVGQQLEVHDVDGPLLTATVTYRADGRTWTQTFTARRLEPADVRQALAGHGLDLLGPAEGDPDWLRVGARPGGPATRT